MQVGRRHQSHGAYVHGLAIGTGVAWATLAGVILARFADAAVPASYLVRPVLLCIPAALVIAAVAQHLPLARHRLAALAYAALLLAVPDWRLVLVGVASVLTLIAIRWRRGDVETSRAVTAIVASFFVLGVVRSVPLVDLSPTGGQPEIDATGPPMYLILLDGYPRADTLRTEFEIDIEPFSTALRERGFDLYPDATSDREWTELTLLAMLQGTAEGVVDRAREADAERAVQRAMDRAPLPRRAREAGYEFTVVDPPIGHVTFRAGTHIRHGGITNFEAAALADSALGEVVARFLPYALTDSLRGHLDDSLRTVAEIGKDGRPRVVLAHLLAPHAPFLYDAAGAPLPVPDYWPRVQLFESVTEITRLSRDAYRDGLAGQLEAVNARLIETVDAVIAREPDAVIVMFSDHGSRYSTARRDEWTRNLLVARTPGQPELFAGRDTPTHILCGVLEAYAGVDC